MQRRVTRMKNGTCNRSSRLDAPDSCVSGREERRERERSCVFVLLPMPRRLCTHAFEIPEYLSECIRLHGNAHHVLPTSAAAHAEKLVIAELPVPTKRVRKRERAHHKHRIYQHAPKATKTSPSDRTDGQKMGCTNRGTQMIVSWKCVP